MINLRFVLNGVALLLFVLGFMSVVVWLFLGTIFMGINPVLGLLALVSSPFAKMMANKAHTD